MKNVLLISLCLLVFSCTSKQKKAEGIVGNYLNSHLKATSSYTSVSFSNLDTTFKRYTDTKQGDSIIIANKAEKQRLEKIKDTLMNLIGTSPMGYQAALKREARYAADTSNLSKTLRDRELLYHGAVDGWYISHTYRAKNDKGSLTTHIAAFTLDSALTKVVNAVNIK